MREQLVNLLSTKIDTKLVGSVIEHYDDIQNAFLKGEWETSLFKTGKFVEAVLKCLHFYTTGNILTNIKVGEEIERLEKLPKGSQPETIKLLIPRACRFAYELASNRNGRHDRTGFDPNRMDATTAASSVAWILAEFIRFFHPTTSDPNEAEEIANNLTTRKAPIIEEIDGKIFVNLLKPTTRKAILALLHLAGGKYSKNKLLVFLEADRYSRKRTGPALYQLKDARLIYEDEKGVLHLRQPGQVEAEKILKETSENVSRK